MRIIYIGVHSARTLLEVIELNGPVHGFNLWPLLCTITPLLGAQNGNYTRELKEVRIGNR